MCTSCRWVFSFSPRSLYLRRKSPRYPLGGPQNWSGRRGEEKIFYPTWIRTPTPSVLQPVATPTALSRLLWRVIFFKYIYIYNAVCSCRSVLKFLQKLVDLYQSTRRHILEDSYRCEERVTNTYVFITISLRFPFLRFSNVLWSSWKYLTDTRSSRNK
jgi:hypothetical protein